MWYRVFTAGKTEPRPDALLTHLNRFAATEGHFRGDGDGWFHADLVGGDNTLSLDRYTADEKGIRAELNTWAAFVESHGGAAAAPLMERLIQTKQLFVIEGPDEAAGRSLGVALCAHLAQTMDGVYQLDGEGFFAADGQCLLRET